MSSTHHPDKTAHAGSPTIISSKIQHQLLPSIQLPTIQSTISQITLNHKPFTVSLVYFPSYPAISSIQLNQFLQSLGQHFLAEGDFNTKHSKWGCISVNKSYKRLQKIIIHNLSYISTKGPTHWPQHQNRHPDIRVLDFFLSSLPSDMKHSVNNLIDLSSDHTPILLTINVSPKLTTPHPHYHNVQLNGKNFLESC